jgi:hypothetical protein
MPHTRSVIIFFATGILVLMTGSCAKKTEKPAEPVYASCKLIKYDTENLSYDSLGRLVYSEYPSRVPHSLTQSESWYYAKGTVIYTYPIVYWNGYIFADLDSVGRIVTAGKYTRYDPDKQYGPNGLINTIDFTYTNKGTKVDIRYKDGVNPALGTHDICTIDSNNGVTHADCYDSSGRLATQVDYKYDDKKNPCRFLFAPPAAFQGYAQYFPGKHNLIKISETAIAANGDKKLYVANINFIYNASGYPVKSTVNGITDNFEYNCK